MKKIGLLALLVLAVIWLNFVEEDDRPKQQKSIATGVQEANYFATHITRELFAENGQKQQILIAAQARHYTNKDILRLDAPKLTQLDSDEPWQIYADKGTLYNQQGQVEMRHNVVVHNPQGDTTTYTKLSTAYLLYHKQQQIAETDAPVTVIQNNASTYAVGMRIELNTKMLYFKQGVISRYAPNP